MMWLLPSFWFPCSKKQRERAAKADSKISKTDNSVLSVLIDSSEILTKYGENKYKKTNSILGDPEADSGGDGKSIRTEK